MLDATWKAPVPPQRGAPDLLECGSASVRGSLSGCPQLLSLLCFIFLAALFEEQEHKELAGLGVGSSVDSSLSVHSPGSSLAAAGLRETLQFQFPLDQVTPSPIQHSKRSGSTALSQILGSKDSFFPRFCPPKKRFGKVFRKEMLSPPP